MNIRILGAHNCESKKTRCVCILIDDILALDAGGLTSALSVSEQKKLRSVLLTHQHYDHIRDIPMIAFNMHQWLGNIQVYCTSEVRDIIENKLLDGNLYPKFQEMPVTKPTVNFKSFNLYETENIEGYNVIAIPVKHDVPTVGYQVSDSKGRAIFYSADTGPDLANCWPHICPHLLLIDVTKPNSQRMFALSTGHLTPNLLYEELARFQELKGYLPQVVIIHMDPMLEQTIADEVSIVAKRLDISITVAKEGMQLKV